MCWCFSRLAAHLRGVVGFGQKKKKKKKKKKALLDEKIASFFLRIYWGKMMHTPKPRVFGAAVLDVVSVRRRGEEDASNIGDTLSVSSSLVVEPAFIVFQNEESKLRVQKLFQFALDGIERAFAVKAPKATTTGSENYLGVAHCASDRKSVV